MYKGKCVGKWTTRWVVVVGKVREISQDYIKRWLCVKRFLCLAHPAAVRRTLVLTVATIATATAVAVSAEINFVDCRAVQELLSPSTFVGTCTSLHLIFISCRPFACLPAATRLALANEGLSWFEAITTTTFAVSLATAATSCTTWVSSYTRLPHTSNERL